MKHITGLAHIALFTKDLEASVKFYECLGGKVTGQADVQKPLGTNHIKIVSMPGFDLEIIEPHDGTDVTAQGGLFPHIAIEVNDIDAAIADLKAAGITSFRGGVDKAADLPIFGGIALVVISMALTFIAGLIPSGIAARKDPVEALRTE